MMSFGWMTWIRFFWNKLYFTIDIGFDLTKANNLAHFSAGSTLGYVAERWSVDSYFNRLSSSQDNVETLKGQMVE